MTGITTSQRILGQLRTELRRQRDSLLLPENLNAQELVRWYEQQLHQEQRQRQGSFFTPEQIVSEIVTPIAAKYLPGETVLDPCCGGGAFLIGALELLSNAASTSGERLARARTLLSRDLCGIDLDPTALLICAAALRLRFGELFPEAAAEAEQLTPRLYCADSILWRDTDWLLEELRGKVSYLIGNPPYGLARDGKLTERDNTGLKSRYREFQFGKVNKYLAALVAGVQLLRPGGELCYLVPNSWLGIRSGERFRRWILENRFLRQITVYDYPVFPSEGVEVVTVRLQNSAAKLPVRISRRESSGTEHSVTIAAAQLLGSPSAMIPTRHSGATLSAIAAIDTFCLPLIASGFRPLIALQAYATGKGSPPQTATQVKLHPFHHETAIDPSCIPYLAGADVGRYRLSWSGEYLQYGPWLAEHQPRERYTSPRLLVREVLATAPYLLRATYTAAPYVYNRSVLHILPSELVLPGAEEALLALLAILNSPIASWILRVRGRKTQRALFPKLVNDDLKEFPIPRDFVAFTPQLTAQSRRLLTNPKDDEAERAVLSLARELYRLPAEYLEEILNPKELPEVA